MKIVTTYKANDKGTGKIVATTTTEAGKRQATVPYDHSRSLRANHGHAAATVALKVKPLWKTTEVLGATCESNESGTRFTFIV